MKTFVLAFALLSVAPVVQAQEAAGPACAAPSDANLSAAWSAWTSPEAVQAATDAAKSPDVMPGHAYALSLSPVTQVVYPVAADKPPMAGTFGGLLSLKITAAGTYSVALNDKAWIDIVKDGTFVRSVAHDHGPACTTVRKAVDFTLEPGLYAIQIASAPTADLKLAIIRK
jgi:hypothetical protein